MSRGLILRYAQTFRDVCLAKQNTAPLSSARIVLRVKKTKSNSTLSHMIDTLLPVYFTVLPWRAGTALALLLSGGAEVRHW